MTLGGGWVIDLDIQAFFDTLDKQHLASFLDQRVRYGVIRDLLGFTHQTAEHCNGMGIEFCRHQLPGVLRRAETPGPRLVHFDQPIHDNDNRRKAMTMPRLTLTCGVVVSLLLSACGTTSGPTKIDGDRWKIIDKNYLEAAKEANAHCQSLGQNDLKVISRKAGEDSVEVIYQCAKE